MQAVEVLKSQVDAIKNNAIDLIKSGGMSSIGEKTGAVKKQLNRWVFGIVGSSVFQIECP